MNESMFMIIGGIVCAAIQILMFKCIGLSNIDPLSKLLFQWFIGVDIFLGLVTVFRVLTKF